MIKSNLRAGDCFTIGEDNIIYKMDEELNLYYHSKNRWQKVAGSDWIVVNILNGNLATNKAILLSKEEKLVLDYLKLCGFAYLAKDKDGEIYAFKEKPDKDDECWFVNDDGYYVAYDLPFIHWEDDEPYKLEVK